NLWSTILQMSTFVNFSDLVPFQALTSRSTTLISTSACHFCISSLTVTFSLETMSLPYITTDPSRDARFQVRTSTGLAIASSRNTSPQTRPSTSRAKSTVGLSSLPSTPSTPASDSSDDPVPSNSPALALIDPVVDIVTLTE